MLSVTKIEVGKWSLSKTKEILWTECSSHLLTFREVPEVRLWPASVNAEHLEDILPELEIAQRERLLEEERRIEEENEKKKMGEPEDMSIRLLKEVLDDLNVTYKASERKLDFIAKVRQARERLQESHCQQYAPSQFGLYRNNDYMDDQSHWHNSCTFKASLFPLIYYDDRKERLLLLLFQLIFLFELLALYLEQLLYQEIICFIFMVYSLYVGLVRCFVTEFFHLWIELLSCWLFAKVNSEMLSGLPFENLPCQSFKCDVDSFV